MPNHAVGQSEREPEISKEMSALYEAIEITKGEAKRLEDKILAVLRCEPGHEVPDKPIAVLSVDPQSPLAANIREAIKILMKSNNHIAEIIDRCEL